MFINNSNKKQFPDRKPNRLKGYDYASGTYYITICTDQKQHLLSKIIEDKDRMTNVVELTSIGREVANSIEHLSSVYSSLDICAYVIMPNHIHILLSIDNSDCNLSLDKFVYQLKSYTSHKYGQKLWQRSYYDHIIRNEKDFNEKYKYIQDNPAKWNTDEYY